MKIAKESKYNPKAFYKYAQSKLKTRRKIGNLKDEEGRIITDPSHKELTPALAKIINNSISQCVFPSDLKKAEVIPLYKKKDHLLKENLDQSVYYQHYLKYLNTNCQFSYKIISTKYSILTYQHTGRNTDVKMYC